MTTTINEKIIIDLESNFKSVYIDGIQILLRLLENVIREPENIKFRKIKLENKVIKDKLLSVNGIKNVLINIGFQESNNEMFLSSTVLIATIKKYRDFLVERLEHVKLNDTVGSSSISTSSGAIKKKFKKNLPPPVKSLNIPRILTTTSQELNLLESRSDSFMHYEDKEMQKYALTLIPLETLKIKAIEKIRRVQQQIKKDKVPKDEPLLPEVLLMELMDWFSTFFTWVSDIPCKICQNSRKTSQSYIENGLRVESITCCNVVTKFPRYNDIPSLLQTRRGRCGEYANCFTFLCRCLDYDARLVHANFDHVWTEVYSQSQKRWIHYDPSENIADAPLVYEHGWKRTIGYVLATSYDDVQDVTWRYTSDYEKTLTNRNTCTEEDLVRAIILIRNKRQQNCSAARKKYLTKRNLAELAGFITPKQPTEDEKVGRSSGSLDWRLSRGEQTINTSYVFEANEEEKMRKKFHLRYSCTKDLYERCIDGNVIKSKSGWESGIFSTENLFRKKETDWKMVYLARTEETDQAKAIWKFDFRDQGLKIKSAKIKFETKTYEDGKVDLIFLDENNHEMHSIEKLTNLSQFSVMAKLNGGKGAVAWQHTQLFRQDLSSNDYPFELLIEFI